MMLNSPLKESLHLIVNYRPLGLVRATPKAFGAFGMTVETGCILLPDQAEVDLTLAYRHEGRNRVHRIPARVIRSEPGETCLEFDTEAWAATRMFLDTPASTALFSRPSCGALGNEYQGTN